MQNLPIWKTRKLEAGQNKELVFHSQDALLNPDIQLGKLPEPYGSQIPHQ